MVVFDHIDQDVVEFDVSMSDEMLLEMNQSRCHLTHHHPNQSIWNDRWWCISLDHELLQRHAHLLDHKELSLAIANRASLASNHRLISSKLWQQPANRVVDLVEELAQESNDVRVARKPHELSKLVDERSLCLQRVLVEVEAHLHRVPLVGP